MDENELAKRLDQLERENMEVAGDEDSDADAAADGEGDDGEGADGPTGGAEMETDKNENGTDV